LQSASSFSQTNSDSTKININTSNVITPVYIRLHIYLGPILGLTQNFISNVIQSTSKFSPKGINIKPSTFGYNIGLSYEERLGESNPYYYWSENEKPNTSVQSIIVNLRYSALKFSSETSIINPEYNNQMLDLSGREKDSSQIPINYKNEIELATICADVLYKLNIFKNFGILAGASFDRVVKHNLKESLSLINSDQTLKFKKQEGIILDESARNGTLFNGEIPNYNEIQLIFKLGTQYEIIIAHSLNNHQMYIIPYFIYGYNVIKMTKNSDTKLSNLNFGFVIRFTL
jgi:hypothetical protein